jgi:hypothetical protein
MHLTIDAAYSTAAGRQRRERLGGGEIAARRKVPELARRPYKSVPLTC